MQVHEGACCYGECEKDHDGSGDVTDDEEITNCDETGGDDDLCDIGRTDGERKTMELIMRRLRTRYWCHAQTSGSAYRYL